MIWFVIFHDKHHGQWWGRRFGHVSLLGYQDTTWLHLDLKRGGVVVEPFHAHDDVRNVLSYFLTHHTILKFGIARAPGRQFFQPMTCVQFVKHTLGVRSRALLPDALFKILQTEYSAEVIRDEVQGTPGNGRATQRA